MGFNSGFKGLNNKGVGAITTIFRIMLLYIIVRHVSTFIKATIRHV